MLQKHAVSNEDWHSRLERLPDPNTRRPAREKRSISVERTGSEPHPCSMKLPRFYAESLDSRCCSIGYKWIVRCETFCEERLGPRLKAIKRIIFGCHDLGKILKKSSLQYEAHWDP